MQQLNDPLATFNAAWHLGRQHRLCLASAPPCLIHFEPERPIYDQLLVLRHQARQARDWFTADSLRDYAELTYGRTIVDSAAEELEGGHHFQHFTPMRLIAWYKKWRPYLASTAPQPVNLERLASRGLSPYGPGWVTIA